MTQLHTPFGTLSIAATSKGLTQLIWQAADTQENIHTQTAHKELQDYFNGKSISFTQNFDLEGTPFQKKVWAEIAKIPYGETRTYSDIALAIGSHPRAVGGATGANPLPIIIPCHRVMGKNGALTGFSGGDGIATKQKLLALEGIKI